MVLLSRTPSSPHSMSGESGSSCGESEPFVPGSQGAEGQASRALLYRDTSSRYGCACSISTRHERLRWVRFHPRRIRKRGWRSRSGLQGRRRKQSDRQHGKPPEPDARPALQESATRARHSRDRPERPERHPLSRQATVSRHQNPGPTVPQQVAPSSSLSGNGQSRLSPDIPLTKSGQNCSS